MLRGAVREPSDHHGRVDLASRSKRKAGRVEAIDPSEGENVAGGSAKDKFEVAIAVDIAFDRGG